MHCAENQAERIKCWFEMPWMPDWMPLTLLCFLRYKTHKPTANYATNYAWTAFTLNGKIFFTRKLGRCGFNQKLKVVDFRKKFFFPLDKFLIRNFWVECIVSVYAARVARFKTTPLSIVRSISSLKFLWLVEDIFNLWFNNFLQIWYVHLPEW